MYRHRLRIWLNFFVRWICLWNHIFCALIEMIKTMWYTQFRKESNFSFDMLIFFNDCRLLELFYPLAASRIEFQKSNSSKENEFVPIFGMNIFTIWKIVYFKNTRNDHSMKRAMKVTPRWAGGYINKYNWPRCFPELVPAFPALSRHFV